jgi:hypothetical protein
MKKLYYLLAATTLLGCQSRPAEVDNRPKEELELVKQIVTADSVYEAQINEITKKEAFNKSEVAIPEFIKTKLNSRADNWKAVIVSIKYREEADEAAVTLRISKGIHFDDKNPEYSSIILQSDGIYEDAKIKEKLKTLQPYDKVLVSGKFSYEKDLSGRNFGSFDELTINDGTILSNPEFSFIITDIKKDK